ncbi:hypothetical protein HWV62_41178 [Athelia sp. TMB]|nr:hypothetical protein HWV62_41178 [Athelia sp. TMB]
MLSKLQASASKRVYVPAAPLGALLPAVSLSSATHPPRLTHLAKKKWINKLPDVTSHERLTDILDGLSYSGGGMQALEAEIETCDPQFTERSLDWESCGSWQSMLSMINELSRTLDRPFIAFLGSGEAEAHEITTLYGHIDSTSMGGGYHAIVEYYNGLDGSSIIYDPMPCALGDPGLADVQFSSFVASFLQHHQPKRTIFHSEFRSRDGLKRQTVLQCLSPYDINLRARLAYRNAEHVWAIPLQLAYSGIMADAVASGSNIRLPAHSAVLDIASLPGDEILESGVTPKLPTPSLSDDVLCLAMQRPVAAEMFSVIENLVQGEMLDVIPFANVPKTLQQRSTLRLSRQDISRLIQPGQWLNDEIINAYGQLLDARSDSKDGYKGVSKWLKGVSVMLYTISGKRGQGLLTGRVKYLLFPISEPVDRAAEIHSGDHWTLGVLNCDKREGIYYDSLHHPKSKGLAIFQKLAREYVEGRAITEHVPDEAKHWIFRAGIMPQQTNSCDCGLFVLAKEVMIVFNQSGDFTQQNMHHVRHHIALQLYAGQVYLPSYPSALDSKSSAEMPEVDISSETVHAAHLLLSLSATAQPELSVAPRLATPTLKTGLRFDPNVNVQEFRCQEASKAVVNIEAQYVNATKLD